MTRWLCVGLVRCAKIWQHVLYAPRGVEVCVGMKQVKVRVIICKALRALIEWALCKCCILLLLLLHGGRGWVGD